MKNFPKHFERENILIATGSKADFAGDVANNVLIDDLHINIDDWRGAGGIGVLHTSPEDTIIELKNLF
jgi:hypothetical protein